MLLEVRVPSFAATRGTCRGLRDAGRPIALGATWEGGGWRRRADTAGLAAAAGEASGVLSIAWRSGMLRSVLIC